MGNHQKSLDDIKQIDQLFKLNNQLKINYIDAQNIDGKEMTSIDSSKAQQNQLQQIYISKQNIRFGFISYKNLLKEGVNIVYHQKNKKYLVQCVIFNSQQQFEQFKSTLMNRIKKLKKCTKIKKILNQITAIYVQKVSKVNCIGFKFQTIFKVYILQEYVFSPFLQFLLSQNFSYCKLKSIFMQLCSIMAAYQFQRLRFGHLGLLNIGIIKQTQSRRLIGKFRSTSSQSTQIDDSKSKVSERSQCLCKVSDGYITDYLNKRQQNYKSRQDQTADVYKNDVKTVGQFLRKFIILKQNQTSNGTQLRSYLQQQNAKTFLSQFAGNHMICQYNVRYNWLQIQRYFQEQKQVHKTMMKQINNQPMQLPQHNLFALKPQIKQSGFPFNPYSSRSVQKIGGMKTPQNNNIPYSDSYRTGNSKMQKHNLPNNKQNNLNNSNQYINLKPIKKCESKSKILVNQVKKNWNSIQELSSICHGPTSISIQNLNIQTTNFNQINPSKSILRHPSPSQNSGYGIIQNECPQFNPALKIKYDNLYNIGKSWTKFQGNFVNGFKEGPGTIYLSNGHLFTGFFVKDLANGKGSVFINGELVIKGTWLNNVLVTQF